MNIDRPIYALGFMFSLDRQRVVLIKKNRPDWQAGFFNGVGGKVEDGETIKEAMVREFHEETGLLEPNAWRHFATVAYEDAVLNCFTCKHRDINEVRTITDEEVHIMQVAVALNGRTSILGNLHWLIPLALDDDIEFSTHLGVVHDPTIYGTVPAPITTHE